MNKIRIVLLYIPYLSECSVLKCVSQNFVSIESNIRQMLSLFSRGPGYFQWPETTDLCKIFSGLGYPQVIPKLAHIINIYFEFQYLFLYQNCQFNCYHFCDKTKHPHFSVRLIGLQTREA